MTSDPTPEEMLYVLRMRELEDEHTRKVQAHHARRKEIDNER